MNGKKRELMALLCLLLAGVLFLWGCGAETPAATGSSAQDETGQRLILHGTRTEDTRSKDFFVPGTERSISVTYMTDVTIELDGEAVSLEQAVQQGRITPEELAAFARLDAVNEHCKLRYKSDRGLSSFYYLYSEYIVEVINDVYETPDGKQHLIECVYIYAQGTGSAILQIDHTFHGEDGYPIDREDWGLTFTVKDVTSTGMTLVIDQSGGQQVGELEISNFSLYTMANKEAVPADQEKRQAFSDATKTVITQNGTTEIQLDWTEVYGELPSGEYYIFPGVDDIYDESQIHPLIVKYMESQHYPVIFTIP